MQTTQTARHEAPQNAPQAHANGADADALAWAEAAKSRQYRVEDGVPQSGVAGMVFDVPPVPGFASLPASVRPLVFQAVTQFVTYRVGQTATGDVAKEIAKTLNGSKLLATRNNDAWMSHYRSRISDMIDEKIGELDKNATKEQKVLRENQIDDTAKAHYDRLFAGIVAEARTASHNRPAKTGVRTRKARGSAEIVEL
jgi:hypothetical protein